jgi:hypothetical protein
VALPGGNPVASIQKKGDSWYCQFLYRRVRYTFTIGKVEEIEAQSVKGKVEYLLMRLKQHLLDLPPGCDIVTFVEWDGKPPGVLPLPVRELTLSELRKVYFKSQDGKLEKTTLHGIHQHFNHLVRILGENCHIPSLSRADLHKYVDTRSKGRTERRGDTQDPLKPALDRLGPQRLDSWVRTSKTDIHG